MASVTLPATEEVMDVEGAAGFLGVSVRSVYRLVADPEVDLQLYQIKGLSRGNRRLKKSELLALLQLEGER